MKLSKLGPAKKRIRLGGASTMMERRDRKHKEQSTQYKRSSNVSYLV